MIELIVETKQEELVQSLAEQLRSRIGSLDALFEPALLVVPNRAIQNYLEFELARILGITPNLHFTLLRSFLGAALPTDGPWKKRKVLTRESLFFFLQDLLSKDGLPWAKECPELLEYLQKSPEPASQERRHFQLARKLAELFTEYDFSRSAPLSNASLPGGEEALLQRWKDLNPGGPELKGVERWQAHIWNALFEPEGPIQTLEKTEKIQYLTLAQAYEEVRPEDLLLPEQFSLFGFAYMARFFVEAIEKISHRSTVQNYILTPTGDWYSTSQPIAAKSPLLQEWGLPGKEFAHQWQRAEARVRRETQPQPGIPTSTTLLSSIQSHIEGIPATSLPSQESDGSLKFLAAPTLRREVESLASQIKGLFENVPTDEPPPTIAVLVAGADLQTYLPQVRAVFSAAPQIPFTTFQVPNPEVSGLIQAGQRLLRLPFGAFTRADLLPLLMHPNLRGRGKNADPELWARWCQNLSIISHPDRDSQANTYVADVDLDLYNWNQGFQRLTLGGFLASSKEDALFELEDTLYLLEDHHSLNQAARFDTLVHSLIHDARWLRDARFSVSRWVEVLSTYFETYLRPSNQNDLDPFFYTAILRAITTLEEENPFSLQPPLLSFRTITEVLHDRLEAIQMQAYSQLTGGVVVSTALALRSLPFDHLFVIGLSEDLFPNKERNDALDLRDHFPRQLGDLSPSQRDRYTFLEALMGARKSLTLSWVAREDTTGETMEASSVVHELLDFINETFAISPELLTFRPPLHRFDDPRPHSYEALKEYSLTQKREALPGSMPSLKALRDHQDHQGWKVLQKDLTLSDFSARPVNQDQTPRTISLHISQLISFLKSPLQGAANIQLGLRDEKDDQVHITHSNLEMGRLVKSTLTRNLATEAALHDLSPAQALQRLKEEQLHSKIIKGELPAGLFLEPALQTLETTLEKMLAHSDKLKLEPPFLQLLFGGARNDASLQSYPPLIFKLFPETDGVSHPTIIELTGLSTLTTPPGDTYFVYLDNEFAGTEKSEPKRDKYYLYPFMSWICATAAGRFHAEEVRLVLSTSYFRKRPYQTTINRFSRSYPSWTQDQARQYIHGLLVELLTEPHDYRLPIEAVSQIRTHHCKDSEDLAPCFDLDTIDDDEISAYLSATRASDQYGPLKDPDRFPPPSPDKTRKLLRRRFPHIFGGLQ